MIKRFIKKIKLRLNPPKRGDIFFGDPVFFIISRPTEYVLHGLKNKYGLTEQNPIPSFQCYKLTIESDFTSNYYECSSEVLCSSALGSSELKWKKRCQSKKISKLLFNEFVLNGLLRKEEDILHDFC